MNTFRIRVFGILAVTFVCTTSMCALAAASSQIRSVATENTVQIFTGDELFTTYTCRPDQKYPYFFPVNGPVSRDSLTTETSEPYPHHHSLFFGCDKVNGGNYWQESLAQGQIKSTELKVLKPSGDSVVIENSCIWAKGNEAPVMQDNRIIEITAPDSRFRFIDFTITLNPLQDVRIERTNHSLFSARMKPELSVLQGGTLINSHGDQKEAGTFGKTSPWCDYYGTHHETTEGLAIFQHPSNPFYPAPWFTRDYGFFSPTPMFWPPNGSHIDLIKGESLVLRYRVVVHTGTTYEAKISDLFDTYTSSEKDTAAPR